MVNYDKDKETFYILELDANNSYGLVMCKKLPYKDFKFLCSFTENDFFEL